MHACGHDAHTAIVLALAKVLNEFKDKLKGQLRLIFQPAEEGQGGAKEMIKAGVLDGVEKVIALHVDSSLESGYIKVQSGSYFYDDSTFNSAMFDNLSGGKVSIEVYTDLANYPSCKEKYEIEIPTRYQMELSKTTTDVQCNGANDGKILYNIDLKGFDKWG